MILRSTSNEGFSLLEVLIALVVLATALLALSGSINQSVKTQVYQNERTFAHYVAMYRLGEVRIDPDWPNVGTTRGQIEMLNREWVWEQTVAKTTEANLRRIEVAVANKKDEDYKLARVTAFIGKPADDERR